MPAYFNSGKFRQVVTLLRATTVPNPDGELIVSYETIGTYPAKVENLEGRELVYARQVVSTATTKVTLRNVGAMSSEDQLQFVDVNGTVQTLGISYVNAVDNRNEYYIVYCSQLNPA